MEIYKENFDAGKSAKTNPEYKREHRKLCDIRAKNAQVWNDLDKQGKTAARKEERKQQRIVQSLPTTVTNDPHFKRLLYCRYADDFLIGVIGSKQDAEIIKVDIGQFLQEKLKLTMSTEKTKVTHGKDKARFLSFDITVRKNSQQKRNKNGKVVRTGSGRIALFVPYEKWRNKLLDYGAMKICKDANGREKWKPIHRGFLTNKSDIEIINRFNAEIRGLYNYYKLAHNATVIHKFAHIMEYSMYKTFGRKYGKSVRYIITKYSRNGEFRIPYTTKAGPKYCIFHNTGFKRQEFPFKTEVEVFQKKCMEVLRPLKLIDRLKAGMCELCGKLHIEVYMHHVKKLKDLTGNSEWEKVMKKKRRKSLAACFDCHKLIHESI
jgi:hypothetical protein